MNTNYDIVIIDKDDKELFTLTNSDNSQSKDIIPSEKESNLIKENISHLISSIPNFVQNINTITTYTAYFPPDAAKRLKDGTAVIMKTKQGELLSNAIDTQNRQIIRQARLKSGVTPANIALICWQLASFVTAQKYLADIDKKLETISKNVEDIKRFQKQHFYSEIESELDYIQFIINSFYSDTNFIQEFEKLHIYDFLRTYKSISKNIKILHEELKIEINRFKESNFDKSKMNESVQNFNDEKNKLVKMINLLIGLTQSQNILANIYKIFNEDSSFLQNWDNEFHKNKEICGNFINELNEIFIEKNKNLDEAWAWYEITGLVIASPLILSVRGASYAFNLISKTIPSDAVKNLAKDMEEAWESESEKDKLKRQNQDAMIKDIEQMKLNLSNMTETYHSSSRKIAFDIDSEEKIFNIRYIES